MGSKKNFIEKKICKVIELGKLYTSMIFFPKNLNSFIGEYAKNRAKSSLKILSFPAAPCLKSKILRPVTCTETSSLGTVTCPLSHSVYA